MTTRSVNLDAAFSGCYKHNVDWRDYWAKSLAISDWADTDGIARAKTRGRLQAKVDIGVRSEKRLPFGQDFSHIDRESFG